jgi:hypothetical protein
MFRNLAIVPVLLMVFSGAGSADPAIQDEDKKPAAPTLSAKLVDQEAKAKKKAATVEAVVTGLEIVDPGAVNEVAKEGQGHLHYQVDDGPIIATTVTKLSFHELTVGKHVIKVSLAGNDHKALGPEQVLNVDVPSGN